MVVCVTQTIPTTGMIVLFGKRVGYSSSFYLHPSLNDPLVWVGPLVVKELKRIVESSEITK